MHVKLFSAAGRVSPHCFKDAQDCALELGLAGTSLDATMMHSDALSILQLQSSVGLLGTPFSLTHQITGRGLRSL